MIRKKTDGVGVGEGGEMDISGGGGGGGGVAGCMEEDVTREGGLV